MESELPFRSRLMDDSLGSRPGAESTLCRGRVLGRRARTDSLPGELPPTIAILRGGVLESGAPMERPLEGLEDFHDVGFDAGIWAREGAEVVAETCDSEVFESSKREGLVSERFVSGVMRTYASLFILKYERLVVGRGDELEMRLTIVVLRWFLHRCPGWSPR